MNQKPGSNELVKLWLIPQDTNVQVLVFSAIAFNGKRFTFGQGIGTTEGGLRVSEIGQLVFSRLCEYSRAEDANVLIVEIAYKERIESRLRDAFIKAPDGAAIMVVCRTSELYDALLPYTSFQAGLYPSAPPPTR